MPDNQINQVLTRGVKQVLPDSSSLAKLMDERKIKVYLGIDPTGSLLTLGHSVVLRKLQQFAELGHETILLIGNGTVKIGDPTGKDKTRPELTNEEIEENFKNWQKQASKVLDFDKIKIMHNGDWLDKMSLPDFIKLMAKTTTQQLLERDMFQKRLEENNPIHTHELMYPLLQGYDSVAMDVDLEIGGTDQTFNMMMGRTLQKLYNNKDKWVLSTPIINGTDGRKMSKSYGNFVALTEAPAEMYGKLMSTSDDQIIPYFTLLTDIALSEIEKMSESIKAGDNPMELKKLLAKTITSMYHDEKSASEAEANFEKTVQNKELPSEMPVVAVNQDQITLLELVQLCLPEESGSNLRRLISQGAVELIPSGSRPTDLEERVGLENIQVVRIGKRKFFRVKTG